MQFSSDPQRKPVFTRLDNKMFSALKRKSMKNNDIIDHFVDDKKLLMSRHLNADEKMLIKDILNEQKVTINHIPTPAQNIMHSIEFNPDVWQMLLTITLLAFIMLLIYLAISFMPSEVKITLNPNDVILFRNRELYFTDQNDNILRARLHSYKASTVLIPIRSGSSIILHTANRSEEIKIE